MILVSIVEGFSVQWGGGRYQIGSPVFQNSSQTMFWVRERFELNGVQFWNSEFSSCRGTTINTVSSYALDIPWLCCVIVHDKNNGVWFFGLFTPLEREKLKYSMEFFTSRPLAGESFFIPNNTSSSF